MARRTVDLKRPTRFSCGIAGDLSQADHLETNGSKIRTLHDGIIQFGH